MCEHRSESSVHLIVGLGNPGLVYRRNRHNLGFMVVDELARRRGLVFKREQTGFALAGAGDGPDILFLFKPMTYMNRSGEALLQWSAASGLALTGEQPVNLIIVCDDLALTLGSLRLRSGGQDGGQNGLASVLESLGTQEISRLRLGIAGGQVAVPSEIWADYVLEDFASDERETVDHLVSYACDALEFWLRNGLAETASRFNRRILPPTGLPENGPD